MTSTLAPPPADDVNTPDRHAAGLGEVLRLALPLVISSLSWTLMNFIDRAMLFGYSRDAVASALPAGVVFFAVICLPWGMASFVNTFVAQYHGAKQDEHIGPAVWQGVWLGVLAWPLVLATIPLASFGFNAFGHTPELVALETTYYQINAWGGGPLMVSAALASYFTGRGRSGVVAGIDSTAAAVNVLLDYLWIYGHAGFPELGIAGAAWATVAALWLKCGLYAVLFLAPEARRRHATWPHFQLDPHLMRRVIRYSLPNGLQTLIEVSGFAVFLLFVGGLGADPLAATSLALNVNNLAFMPVWGIGLAASTLVGQYLGQDRPKLAVRGTYSALTIAALYMGTICATYVLAPDVVMFAHATLGDEGYDPALRDMVVVLLRFAAMFGMCDAVSIIFSGALKGAGDTMFILRTNLVMATVPVALTYLGIRYWGGGVIWAWWMLSAWVAGLAIIFTLRFYLGPWREMRVIETPGHADAG